MASFQQRRSQTHTKRDFMLDMNNIKTSPFQTPTDTLHAYINGENSGKPYPT